MGQDMNHPSRLISQRVNAINEEIVKQRQYLPQFKNSYHHISKGRNSQKSFQGTDSRSKMGPMSQGGFEGTNYNNALMDQGYAVVARHHAQSMVSPHNFRDNMQQLHEQQRMQMEFMDQQAAFNHHGLPNMRKKFKKHSYEEQALL